VSLFSKEKIKEKYIEKNISKKKEASYKKNRASDKANKHTNNLYRAKFYNVSNVHQPQCPHGVH